MKKALTYFLAVGLIVWLSLSLTWWSFMIPALVGGYFLPSERRSFLLGFGTIAVLFAIILLVRNEINDGILLGRISEMFRQSSTTVLLISILLPAILAGLASWCGTLIGMLRSDLLTINK